MYTKIRSNLSFSLIMQLKILMMIRLFNKFYRVTSHQVNSVSRRASMSLALGSQMLPDFRRLSLVDTYSSSQTTNDHNSNIYLVQNDYCLNGMLIFGFQFVFF